MTLILGTNSIKDTGYDVANSLRFNDDSTDYLNRTPSGAGNRRTFTISCWIKRGQVTTLSNIMSAWGSNADSGHFLLRFDSAERLDVSTWSTNVLTTNRLFRDPSAWYHVVCAVDTTSGTADQRVRLYVNGVEETSFSTRNNPSQNTDLQVNNNSIQVIGANYYTSSAQSYSDGYLAEFVLIDGQALTPTSFGEFDEDSPTIWKPKDVSGLTFGTNGFYLDFEDSSALGNDVSGNNNDFTANNLTSVDQSTDTCTNNFCTLNSLDNYFAGSTFAEGNCKVTYLSGSGKYGYNTGTIALSSGKWYHEVKITQSVGSNYNMFGLEQVVSASASHEFASSSTGYVLNGNNGTVYVAGSNQAYGVATAVNDIIGVYVDLDNNKLYFAKNGTVMNSGTGISIAAVSSTTNGYYFVIGGDYSSGTVGIHEFNFGSPTFAISSGNTDDNGYGNFEYSPNITGDGVAKKFYALNTKNLAEYG